MYQLAHHIHVAVFAVPPLPQQTEFFGLLSMMFNPVVAWLTAELNGEKERVFTSACRVMTLHGLLGGNLAAQCAAATMR